MCTLPWGPKIGRPWTRAAVSWLAQAPGWAMSSPRRRRSSLSGSADDGTQVEGSTTSSAGETTLGTTYCPWASRSTVPEATAVLSRPRDTPASSASPRVKGREPNSWPRCAAVASEGRVGCMAHRRTPDHPDARFADRLWTTRLDEPNGRKRGSRGAKSNQMTREDGSQSPSSARRRTTYSSSSARIASSSGGCS